LRSLFHAHFIGNVLLNHDQLCWAKEQECIGHC